MFLCDGKKASAVYGAIGGDSQKEEPATSVPNPVY